MYSLKFYTRHVQPDIDFSISQWVTSANNKHSVMLTFHTKSKILQNKVRLTMGSSDLSEDLDPTSTGSALYSAKISGPTNHYSKIMRPMHEILHNLLRCNILLHGYPLQCNHQRNNFCYQKETTISRSNNLNSNNN